MDNFIQITVLCPPEPRVGAFVYRNAGKVYGSVNSKTHTPDILGGGVRPGSLNAEPDQNAFF